jgi:hypothetical protein
MYLELIRFKFKSKTVMGVLKGDVLKCGTYFTIENFDKMLPDGKYMVKVTYSPKFKRDVPIVYNDEVPESRGIRIHEGNIVQNSNGCILVGNWAYLPNKLGNSKDAIEQLTWALTKHGEPVVLVITTDF